jgi:hypothetical protein
VADLSNRGLDFRLTASFRYRQRIITGMSPDQLPSVPRAGPRQIRLCGVAK